MNLLTSAISYAQNGLSVIPTDSAKTSLVSWKRYQSEIASKSQLEAFFSHIKCKGLAVICGKISGNLEVIDIDCKYGIDVNDYFDKILNADPILFNKLKIIKTISGGYHIYYRCEKIEGNQKLAERYATKDELYDNPNAKQFVLIETRGEAGYVIAPPTPGYQPMDKNDIPTITIDERDMLLSIARDFNEVIETYIHNDKPSSKQYNSVFEAYNNEGDVVGLLQKHGWSVVGEDAVRIRLLRPGQTTQATSAVIFKDKRIFYPHTTSTTFKNKGYNPFSVYAHLECGDNWRKAADLLSEVYDTKSDTDFYWSFNRNGRVEISRYKLQDHLYNHHNVHLYFHDKKSGTYRLVMSNNKQIEEIYPESIKKLVKKELEEMQEYDVIEALMKNANSIFNDSFFEFINEREVKILKDEKNKCFFPFKNQIITISKDEISAMDYKDVEGYIWKNQIIDKDITLMPDFDVNYSVYYKFIKCISSDDPARINYAITLIGYILHSYKDPTKPYAPILAEETDDEAKGGGTGKGIFFQAVSKLIPVVRIDGKNFKIDKTFAFQRVGLGTKLVVIEDCPKNVDFERYYPTITEGITIEKKNQDELFLSYAESPKIAFTTNYSINGTAEHAKRRQRVLEFAPFFSSTKTPQDHFGHQLFDEWDYDEWMKFYNFLFYCVKRYMNDGILAVDNSEKLKRKQAKLQFGEEFLEYIEDIFENYLDRELSISTEWKSFLERYEMDKKDYSLKRFKKGLEIVTKLFNKSYNHYKNRQNNNLMHFKISENNNNMPDTLDKGYIPVTDVTDLF